jgi:hypothetical protein
MRSRPLDAEIVRVLDGYMHKLLIFLLLVASCAIPALGQGAPAQGGADQPYTMQDPMGPSAGVPGPVSEEPLPSATEDRLDRTHSPANHITEGARWDYRVTMSYKTRLSRQLQIPPKMH